MAEIKKLAELVPDEHNANRGSARGQKQIVGSIQRNGFGRSGLLPFASFIGTILRTANLPSPAWRKFTETYRAYFLGSLRYGSLCTLVGAMFLLVGMGLKGLPAILTSPIFNTSQGFTIASVRAKSSVVIAKKFLMALLASLDPILTSFLTSFFASALGRATNLLHLVRLKVFATNWAYFTSKYIKPVCIIVAVWAKSDTIAYIISKLRIFRPAFNMMRLQNAASDTAFLTGEVIARQNAYAPFFVFYSSVSYITLSGSASFPSLIVRQLIPFFHRIPVYLLPFVGSEKHLSAFRYFLGSVGAFISTLSGAIFAAFLTFVLDCKLGFTKFAILDHLELLQSKTPLAVSYPFVATHTDNRAGVRNDNTIAARIGQLFCMCDRGIIA